MDRTARLSLDLPTSSDLDSIHLIYSDARTWTHFPSGRLTSREQTDALLTRWIEDWQANGLGSWVVREAGRVVGHGGCTLQKDRYWNLGYRFAPEAQGRGLATELACAAVDAARRNRPDLPVVAKVLEHNAPSFSVAKKAGLSLRYRGTDRGNPDEQAVRLVLADRDLSDEVLALILGWAP
ncbi:N-acetyltransferase [Kocuria tytonicola]|uniref:GNAT family N-acetyltransferase n=1 Tax=Kocuria tytonicola TaxID=2055946 RepID=UPI000EF89611|nr:GNAT family N-acetyltransferase [Kocuria tytonicola]RLZ03631.1 N-acetyltransferase [Kocuria tytonicola]